MFWCNTHLLQLFCQNVYHFVREKVEEKLIKLQNVKSEHNTATYLPNPSTGPSFKDTGQRSWAFEGEQAQRTRLQTPMVLFIPRSKWVIKHNAVSTNGTKHKSIKNTTTTQPKHNATTKHNKMNDWDNGDWVNYNKEVIDACAREVERNLNVTDNN